MVSNRAHEVQKRFLVIEGGGADGLAALGAVKFLIQNKHHTYEAMFGTSIGAAITLGIACILKQTNSWDSAITTLESQMATLTKWDLIKRPAFFGFLNGGYLVSNIKNTVNRLFARDTLIKELPVYCEAFTTDYDAEEPIKGLNGDYRVDDAIAMSTNIPGAFCFYKDPLDLHRCYDGGIACNDPIAHAVEYAQQKQYTNVQYVVIRMGTYKPMRKGLFLTATEVLFHGFEIARRQCERLSLKLSQQYLENDVRILHLPFDIGLLAFNKKTNKENIIRGFKFAEENYHG